MVQEIYMLEAAWEFVECNCILGSRRTAERLSWASNPSESFLTEGVKHQISYISECFIIDAALTLIRSWILERSVICLGQNRNCFKGRRTAVSSSTRLGINGFVVHTRLRGHVYTVGSEVGLSEPWVDALKTNSLATFAKLSFAITSPGTVASDEQTARFLNNMRGGVLRPLPKRLPSNACCVRIRQ